ncbi:MAG: FtsW/RodA/SpoVE family cell cycle protein [Anaerolineaceae bacterium]|nr:FtsW/RodA/SpoVE family cell cycle protein [Anaerolineaceae bacterium]
MGERAFVNPSITAQQQEKRSKIKLAFDTPLLIIVLCLAVIGLLSIYSASWSHSLRVGLPASYFLTNQIKWFILGSVIAASIGLFDYKLLLRKEILLFMMGVTVLLLVAVLFVKDDPSGLNRGLFRGSVQPSELAKLVIIVYLAAWLTSRQEQLNKFTLGLVPVGIIVGFIGGLIAIQPDVSATITVFALGGLLFFLSGGDMRHIILMLLLIVLVGGAVILVSDRAERILTFNPNLQNVDDVSYHIQRSLEAVIRGGWFGVGIGKSTTKSTGLPVPWTDSIYAVIVEETGIFGGAIIISLFLLLLWRGIVIARRAPDLFGKLLAGGITFWVVIEAFINIGVLVNLIPFAGNALPFISSGGSSLITTMIGIGLLLSVARMGTVEKNKETRNSNAAVINLRGRNRRRDLPRDRRS